MLAVPATLYFVSNFHRVAPAVVAADFMRAFAIGATSLGNLAAVYPYVFAAMALVAVSLADTLGPRSTMTLGGRRWESARRRRSRSSWRASAGARHSC